MYSVVEHFSSMVKPTNHTHAHTEKSRKEGKRIKGENKQSFVLKTKDSTNLWKNTTHLT